MPQLIEHIDAIARQKQRDVLFLEFFDPENLEGKIQPGSVWHWASSADRQSAIEWFNHNQIHWQPCGSFADENSMTSYAGQVYIDVPFEEKNPVYQKVLNHLENPDGSPRFPGVLLFLLPLDVAMKNAHHDEPGFWDRWAENF